MVMDGATEMWAVSGEYLSRQARCPGAATEALTEQREDCTIPYNKVNSVVTQDTNILAPC